MSPDILPNNTNGWKQSWSIYSNAKASFFYYHWMTIGPNCELPNRAYYFGCFEDNVSSVSCANYPSEFGVTFRGIPTIPSGTIFYQQKFHITYESSTTMKIMADSSSVYI